MMSDPAGTFIWYELLTTDLGAARGFYASVIGLAIPAEATPGPMDYRMVTTPGGGTVGGAMALSPQMVAGGARPGWYGYVKVADVDAAVADVTAAGGKALMPPSDIPGAGRIAMIADPQGAALYLMRPAPPPGMENVTATAFDPEKHGHVAWNELHAADGAAALAFYADRLGWEKSDALDMGALGAYQMFRLQGSDQAIGAMLTSPQMPQPMWVYYFNVPDIDAAAESAAAEGGRLLYGPAEIPGGQFIFQATDPQGAVFAAVGPRREG
jgi:uncharacterized protein